MATDPSDPLEKAREALARLKDADDWDEPTDRHEVNVTVQLPPQPAPQPSQPEIVVEKRTEGTEEKTTIVVKHVGFLAKLMPPEHRVWFLCMALLVGSVLLALQQGWIRFVQP